MHRIKIRITFENSTCVGP